MKGGNVYAMFKLYCCLQSSGKGNVVGKNKLRRKKLILKIKIIVCSAL